MDPFDRCALAIFLIFARHQPALSELIKQDWSTFAERADKPRPVAGISCFRPILISPSLTPITVDRRGQPIDLCGLNGNYINAPGYTGTDFRNRRQC
jgi:hypothetical protein